MTRRRPNDAAIASKSYRWYLSYTASVAKRKQKLLERLGDYTGSTAEFDTAVTHVSRGLIEPLASYVEGNPLTSVERRYVAELLRELMRTRGRPTGKLSGPVYEAERAAVSMVRFGQRCWRDENNRTRVPREITDTLIIEAIAAASTGFDLSTNKMNADRIRSLLHGK